MVPRPHRHRRDDAAQRAQILEDLLLTQRERLLRHVHHHSQRPEDADDALADACLQFLRFYPGSSKGDDPLRWMLAVSKRCAWEIERRRRERGKLAPMLSLDETNDAIALEIVDAAELIERNEAVDAVIAAINRLAPDERTALILFGLGFSYAEIADLRGWSYGKVHRRLSEGRARVRRWLEGVTVHDSQPFTRYGRGSRDQL